MIGIVGAGAFGAALALSLGRGNIPVTLWGRNLAAWRDQRICPRLPDVHISDHIVLSDDLRDLQGADAVLLCVPMQQLGAALAALPLSRSIPHIACCKGIELTTGRDPAQIITAYGARSALLTGPSFAADIANGLPTALTLACSDVQLGAQLQTLLARPALRLYTTQDMRGAALGGALKNVIAIACGAVMGAGLGTSARAAIMTRGFAEMRRYALAMGAQAETLVGLSGFGDLALTCMSDLSRNYRYGVALGQGIAFDARLTVEGAATARALSSLQDMPITHTVAALANGDLTAHEAIALLMARPLRAE